MRSYHSHFLHRPNVGNIHVDSNFYWVPCLNREIQYKDVFIVHNKTQKKIRERENKKSFQFSSQLDSFQGNWMTFVTSLHSLHENSFGCPTSVRKPDSTSGGFLWWNKAVSGELSGTGLASHECYISFPGQREYLLSHWNFRWFSSLICTFSIRLPDTRHESLFLDKYIFPLTFSTRSDSSVITTQQLSQHHCRIYVIFKTSMLPEKNVKNQIK